jgi:hypothetical protein
VGHRTVAHHDWFRGPGKARAAACGGGWRTDVSDVADREHLTVRSGTSRKAGQ